jgi:hypothetical protein
MINRGGDVRNPSRNNLRKYSTDTWRKTKKSFSLGGEDPRRD